VQIQGNIVDLRLVELDDAAFILSLRLDERLNRHITRTDAGFDRQVEWLRQYKEREREKGEFYFIIQDKAGNPCGTLRLYDFQGDSFCWGSWIMQPGSPGKAALESALLAYRCGFEELGFARSHFEVDKANDRVVAFHQRFGATVVREDEKNYYFQFSRTDFESACLRYAKLWK
jgi:RimJ/RimL family protein N-acetyltransferase